MSYDIIGMKTIAQTLNDRTYTDYFYRLMLLAKSVFKWNNLPNGIDEKWIERYLFTEGKCVFFKDETKGLIVTKCTESGEINFWDEPTIINPIGTNSTFTPRENNVDCVLIRNNDDMIPTFPTIELYALRLAELTRTIDINVHAQRTPVIITCSEKQRLTLKNVYKQWNGFEPVIYGDKNIDVDGLSTLKTDAPIVFPQLQVQKHAVWNEVMSFLGINNANQEKRERLVADEVQANNEQVQLSAQIMLKARQRACEQINEMFGTNISVEIRNLEITEFEPKPLEKVGE